MSSYHNRTIDFKEISHEIVAVPRYSLWDHSYADFEACLLSCGVFPPYHVDVPCENIENCLYHCQRIEEPISCDIAIDNVPAGFQCDPFPLYLGPDISEQQTLGTIGENICMDCFEIKIRFGDLDFHDSKCAVKHKWLAEMPYVYHFTDSGMIVWERTHLSTARIDRTKLVRFGSPSPLVADGRICIYRDEDQRCIDRHKRSSRKAVIKNRRGKWHGTALKSFLGYDD